ncbi:type II toxin-antitoxin system RatA family toxin [Lysobacter olei]
MPTIRRSALVEHSAARMYALVNDVAAYPRRFDWCEAAQVLEEGESRKVARLDLRMGALRTWFMTENTLAPPHHIDMRLIDGPFRKLGGRWEFHSLDESACKVTLTLDFEPSVKLLGAAMAVGFQGLADRMVDDFVRVADRGDVS